MAFFFHESVHSRVLNQSSQRHPKSFVAPNIFVVDVEITVPRISSAPETEVPQ